MRVLIFLLAFLLTTMLVAADYVDLSKFIKKNESINAQELGSFKKGEDLVYWSNETKRYFTTTESKLTIDQHSYVVDFDLFKGYIVIYSNITKPCTIVDVFSGNWKKTLLKKGYNYFNFSEIGEYAGLRIVSIGTPQGFALLKQKRDIFYFEDYPIAILKAELAKFSWERAFYSLCLWLFGFGLSYYFKRDRLIVSLGKHLAIMLFVAVLLLSLLAVDYTTYTVKINQTAKQIPHLALNKYKVKDMWNWAYVVFFSFGYMFGVAFASYRRLYLALVSYSKPIQLYILPYSKGVVRDVDGKLSTIKFKQEVKQLTTFNINGVDVKGILAVNIKDVAKSLQVTRNSRIPLIAFFGILALAIVGDFLNVFRIDLAYSLLFAVITAVFVNFSTIKQKLGLEIEKEKIIECSELLNEDNFTKMLKEAEIRHVIEDYNKLLRAYVKEKITMPRKTIKHLLSMIKEIKAERGEKDENKG